MSITRWDPWGEAVSLRQAMDSLLQESVVRPRSGSGGATAVTLALDIEERGDDFVITTPIPGMKPETSRSPSWVTPCASGPSAEMSAVRRVTGSAGCSANSTMAPLSARSAYRLQSRRIRLTLTSRMACSP